MASVLSTFSPSFYPYHGRGNACKSWRKHTLGCLHLRWSSGKSGCGEGKELLPSPCFLPWHISTSAKQTFMDLWSFPALPSALSCPPVGTEGTLECKASTSCAQCFLQPPAPASVSPEFSLWHRGILSRLKSHSKTAHPNPIPSPHCISQTLSPSSAGLASLLPGQVRSTGQSLPWLSAWHLLNKQLLALASSFHCLHTLSW